MLASLALLGTAATARAQAPAPAAETKPKPPPTFNSIFTEAIPRVDLRTRGEFGSQGGLNGTKGPKDSMAWTARARLGLQTGEFAGVQAYAELEHTEATHRDRYNGAPGPHNENLGAFDPVVSRNRVVIADPESNELNQAWLAYAAPFGRFKIGRQRITLDEHRFIGNVGWRDNEQTYDAAAFTAQPVKNLELYYAWVTRVNRIFGSRGDDERFNALTRDFDSRSHLIQASYKFSDAATFRAYSFLLDLRRKCDRPCSAGALPGPKYLDAGSTNTYGVHLIGSKTLGGVKFAYRGEYAWQTDASRVARDFDSNYYHVKASGTLRGVTLGFAREVLGSDRGSRIPGNPTGARAPSIGFATPLATLHAFNGYADLFLNTPPNGLIDDYAFVNWAAPWKLNFELAFHKYASVFGHDNFGREINFVLRRPMPWNITGLIKVASYRNGDTLAPGAANLRDTLRIIGQLEYRLNP